VSSVVRASHLNRSPRPRIAVLLATGQTQDIPASGRASLPKAPTLNCGPRSPREFMVGRTVFINYRGEDSHTCGALLYEHLTGRFGKDLVFLDCESIPAGADFVEELLGRVRSARIVLAVIGPSWLTAINPTTGRRRIEDPADWIRRELAEAFAAGVRVIPVLTDQAELPAATDLPADIAALSRCQYRHLRRREPTSDLARIVTDLTTLDPILAASTAAGTHRIGSTVIRHVQPGRDAYVSGRDMQSIVARNTMLDNDPTVHQFIAPGGDTYVPGRDLHYNEAARMPSRKRRIWGNVPARNPVFTGREPLLAAIREALVSSDRAVVHALYGMGGVGKTQLAIEYVHRYEAYYDVVWWLNSESMSLLGGEFATLAVELGCASVGAQLDAIRRAVLMALRELGHSLLIFDNADNPQDIAGWIPGGEGHVLITSRASNWHDLAVPVEVDVFTRSESIASLRRVVPLLTRDDAGRVAEAVGDLPLAVMQAASYMTLTSIPPDAYLRLLNDRPTAILDHGKPWSYPRSLAAATILSFDQLCTEAPAAAEVMAICAFLAPEPISTEWFPRAAEHLSISLGERAADAVAWHDVIARMRGSALIRLNAGSLIMHRLTRAIIYGYLSVRHAEAAHEAAARVITLNHPGETSLPAAWPAWAALLPHILALDPAESDYSDLRNLAVHALFYLIWRGDLRAAIDMARYLLGRWRVNLGEDHPDTLWAANGLACVLHDLGEYRMARDLHENTLERHRRMLGEDHPDTLWSATYLARDMCSLGEYGTARDLSEQVLARCRRVLGEDDKDTLWCADGLARALRGLGEYRAARDLYEEVLERHRRVLGEDHPGTLWAANGLACVLHDLGEYRMARELHEDALARRRRVLGEDHLDTLVSASNLADILSDLREFGPARDLYDDVLARRRRVLGEDHHDTQRTAENLTAVQRRIDEK
jgi:tetratricopeptide (TPR) repeat protein